ncbi:IclR family transcriptional regulator [Enterobacteriaceae bacterium H11S18]|uniref:IclR family transcriptional regulator n=1 Tax=Dryocola clanedunensis TaxID=2925396 RepID=UPI0022F0727C|nr:IclR family transcriptional regulator [Dryocola clanedunensis]MCT4705838.1 IclR family transcriptional regulator [Dryocola clanedunensis]MCT4711563.1 IclR family transcriptional regulator [Dryocola clanedunensis]
MSNNLQSAALVLSVLNYFTLQKTRWGVRELAREIGRSPSVVQRALTLLEAEGYLYQEEVGRTYQLGFRCIELGHLANETRQFSQIAAQCLKPLVEQSGETVFIYRRREDISVCSYIQESSQHIRFTTTVGESLFLHQAPFTQVTLAFMKPEERLDYLSRHQLQADAALLETLELFAQQGYASSHEAWQPHTQGLSVPLFNVQKEVAGSLCIAASTLRDDLIVYKPLLIQAAVKLSSVL